jgi:hypothetical protein
MSFKFHTSCERCGSSDARAVYSGGSSYCFSCGSSGRGEKSPYVVDEEYANTKVSVDLSLPLDASTDYSALSLAWVSKYGLSTAELISNSVLWSEAKQQLIFTFKDAEGKLLLWQARNFYPGAKLKYYTRGTPESVLPIYHGRLSDTVRKLVLVEDCVSAIKVARQASAMAVLRSDLSKTKLTRLAAFQGPSCAFVVWLDGNMYDKAQRIADRLQLLGCDAHAIYTELDPKEYDDDFIATQI